MKPNSQSFLFALCSTLTISFLFASAQTTNPPVLDIAGEVIKEGLEYYVLPFQRQSDGPGGLSLDLYGNQNCPLSIILEPFTILNGLSVSFKQVNSTPDGSILESSILYVEFIDHASVAPCTSALWITERDKPNDEIVVTLGGFYDDPVNSKFAIQSYGLSGYKFVAPDMAGTDYNITLSTYVAVSSSIKRRLIMTFDEKAEPYAVEFIKKTSTTWTI